MNVYVNVIIIMLIYFTSPHPSKCKPPLLLLLLLLVENPTLLHPLKSTPPTAYNMPYHAAKQQDPPKPPNSLKKPHPSHALNHVQLRSHAANAPTPNEPPRSQIHIAPPPVPALYHATKAI